MGGLAAAATLRAIDAEVRVYEQASRFARIGAGIQMLPNSMKVLRGIGIEDKLRGFAFAPRSHLNREWDSGDIRAELPMPEDLYGAPYLCMHRGDLHDALASQVPPDIVSLGKKLAGLNQIGNEIELSFTDGTRARADAVIGADGVHSTVREILFGGERPVNRGRVAYRAVYPAARRPRSRDLAHQVVGQGPPHRHLLHDQAPRRGLFRHQPARTARVDDARILVGEGRREGTVHRVRRVPCRRARGAGSLPGLPQVGDPRARSAAELEQWAGHAARRRLPPDDAVHGAGRRHFDRGRRRAVSLPSGF